MLPLGLNSRRSPFLALLCIFVLLGVRFHVRLSSWLTIFRGRATVAERLETIGPSARAKLRTRFHEKGIAYPPRSVVLVGLKEERELRVYADNDGAWHLAHTYPVLAASGGAGPKLRSGDRQVPEGVYFVESLNPNSRFHLSLRLSYPNAFDRDRARVDGRSDLGGDIMIHGGSSSIGCLAVGDPSSEELFVVVADVGLEKTKVLLAPRDLVARPLELPPQDSWNRRLYADLRDELEVLTRAPSEHDLR